MLETHMKLRVTKPDFLGNVFFCLKNWENEPKMGQEQTFLSY